MLEISNVKMPLDAGLPGPVGEAALRSAVAAALGVSVGEIGDVQVLKRSVDARKKADVHFVATLAVSLTGGEAVQRRWLQEGSGLRAAPGVNVKQHDPAPELHVPDCTQAAASSQFVRPVVVGAGPAGLFAALYLAQAGLRPLLVERGGSVDERAAAVSVFAAGGALDTTTNVQFGEGGAGAFSDGKLTTGTKSPHIRHVLQAFVDAGAPEEILWQAKPHIGTDLLPGVVRALRERIIASGGEVRFHTQLEALRFEDGVLVEAELRDTRDAAPGATWCIPARCVVLACGHSARDTFEMLRDVDVAMERKPFSVGVRIEHRQADIDRAQYGGAAVHPALGAADYKLAMHLNDGRGVYTFCMCPGGTVVAATSEDGGVCVNGMSVFARDGENANSALLVDVRPDDLAGEDVLAGVTLQRDLEHAAYQAGVAAGGRPFAAPAQTVGDFLAGRSGAPSATVHPTYPRGVAWCNLREVLPPFVSDALAEALPLLGRKLRGFDDAGAVMTGVEARSSSPVRIVRDEGFQAYVHANGVGNHTTESGLFPCGEGAGYAGGIMSAAVDGLRVAEAVARRLST